MISRARIEHAPLCSQDEHAPSTPSTVYARFSEHAPSTAGLVAPRARLRASLDRARTACCRCRRFGLTRVGLSPEEDGLADAPLATLSKSNTPNAGNDAHAWDRTSKRPPQAQGRPSRGPRSRTLRRIRCLLAGNRHILGPKTLGHQPSDGLQACVLSVQILAPLLLCASLEDVNVDEECVVGLLRNGPTVTPWQSPPTRDIAVLHSDTEVAKGKNPLGKGLPARNVALSGTEAAVVQNAESEGVVGGSGRFDPQGLEGSGVSESQESGGVLQCLEFYPYQHSTSGANVVDEKRHIYVQVVRAARGIPAAIPNGADSTRLVDDMNLGTLDALVQRRSRNEQRNDCHQQRSRFPHQHTPVLVMEERQPTPGEGREER